MIKNYSAFFYRPVYIFCILCFTFQCIVVISYYKNGGHEISPFLCADERLFCIWYGWRFLCVGLSLVMLLILISYKKIGMLWKLVVFPGLIICLTFVLLKITPILYAQMVVD